MAKEILSGRTATFVLRLWEDFQMHPVRALKRIEEFQSQPQLPHIDVDISVGIGRYVQLFVSCSEVSILQHRVYTIGLNAQYVAS